MGRVASARTLRRAAPSQSAATLHVLAITAQLATTLHILASGQPQMGVRSLTSLLLRPLYTRRSLQSGRASGRRRLPTAPFIPALTGQAPQHQSLRAASR